MRRLIRWQSWENPLGGGPEWVWREGAKPRKKKKRRDPYDEDEGTPVRPMILTDAGLIAAKVYGNAEDNFVSFVGHTTFIVDKEEVGPAIRDTLGVEAFMALSPVRFKIAIGRAFRPSDVIDAIHERLGVVPHHHGWKNPRGYVLDETTTRNVGLVRESLSAKGEYWGILVLPNGSIDSFSAEDWYGFSDHYDVYDEIIGRAGGLFCVP